MPLSKKNIVFFVLFAFLSLLIGCTPKIRSFFFDGVPFTADTIQVVNVDSPKQPDTIRSEEIAGVSSQQLVYYHPPYQNKKCKICHDPSTPGKLLQEQPELCNNCHDDYNSEFRFVHGPVGGGQCTSCHSPHQSENKKLLLYTGQELCFFCHDSRNILNNKTHKEIGITDCQECHNPHGSDKKYFLK